MWKLLGTEGFTFGSFKYTEVITDEAKRRQIFIILKTLDIDTKDDESVNKNKG